jgi:hypothetical protein
MALDAASKGEHETFHDLAWRAVQKGPRNDPDLMLLLARAQSLSGRPLDALVTLRRLAERGVAADASGDDFRRTRALEGWPAVEAFIAQVRATESAPPAVATPPAVEPSRDRPAPEPVSPEPPPVSAAPPKLPVRAGRPKPPVPSAPPAPPAAAAPEAARAAGGGATTGALPIDRALRFVAPPFVPAGLAYDAVSRRFLIGNRHEQTVVIVSEGAEHVVSLAGRSAALFDVMAIEIDRRRGDLWVVSASASGETALHKLQLVSGRLLYAVEPPEGTAARFVDVAVTAGGTVFVLDEAGRRVLRLEPGARTLARGAALPDGSFTSIAPAREGVLYAAHREGLLRVDLAAGTAKPVRAASPADLAGLDRIRWHRGSIVAMQTLEDGTRRVVRIRLAASGLRASSVATLDDALPAGAAPASAALSGDDFFYLVGPTPVESGDIEATVRKIRIQR